MKFQPGLRVRHGTWGDGTVLMVTGADNNLINVIFDEFGLKCCLEGSSLGWAFTPRYSVGDRLRSEWYRGDVLVVTSVECVLDGKVPRYCLDVEGGGRHVKLFETFLASVESQ